MTNAARKKLLFTLLAIVCISVTLWTNYSFFSSYDYGIRIECTQEFTTSKVISVDPNGPAAKAGLKESEVIVGFNDVTVDSCDGYLRLLGELQRSEKIRLMVRSEAGAIRSLYLEGNHAQVTNQLYLLILSLVGLMYVTLGCWVFFARPQYPAASAWGVFSLLMGCSLLVSNKFMMPLNVPEALLATFIIGLILFAAAAVLHFALIFPRPWRMAHRWVIGTLYTVSTLMLLFIGVLLILEYVFPTALSPDFSAPFILEFSLNAYMVLYFGLTVIALLVTYVRIRDLPEKRRIRWFIFGTAIPLALILILILMAELFNYHPAWAVLIVYFSIAFIPIACFYAIVRHRALQMEVILRRGLIYTLLTGVVLVFTGIVYLIVIGLGLILQDVVSALAGEESTISQFALDPTVQKVAIAVWAVFIGATIGRLKRRTQEFVDRRFYRQKYDYRQAMRELASVLSRTDDKDSMLEIVIENAENLVHPRSIAIVLLDGDGSAVIERAIPKDLELERLDSSSVQALKERFRHGRQYLGKRELDEEYPSGEEHSKASFERLGADICLPLRSNGNIAGYLFIGPKLSELDYNLEDIELLGMLADQTAVGLEHTELAVAAAEKERITKELEIGRRIQEGLLPAAPPQLEGASIAALNIPAMEVGGDFYHFVEYSPTKVGIIAGDIVGKGVPGALNMAATISSLRLIAEESDSVSEAMHRLNRYLVRSSASRSFAATIYAVIDLDEMCIRWSNAGLPEPVLIPAEGPTKYLEMECYSLPPGASANSDYLQAEYELHPGDKVVFVTDGLIEAHPTDDSSKVFGFDSLLHILSEHRDESPESLIRSLADRLYEFCGTTVLEDDFTAVAVHIDTDIHKHG